MKRPSLVTLCLAGTLGLCPSILAEDPAAELDLRQFSLEELMQFEITSVSKKRENLFEASAAVFVITNDDIRRYGATTIPEALRLAPGLEVARIDGNKWAVTTRGFNGQFANKLLVLIDGRSVYSPMFSGIFWEIQDVPLDDVDRIEVIRGPGAALWGANAVNGIVNIISKKSSDTQGGLLVAGGGTFESGRAGLRYGGKMGNAGHYRAFVKYHERDALDLPAGGSGSDESETLHIGFRTDWSATERDELTVQGDYYDGEIGQTYTLIDSFIPPFTSTFDFDTGFSGGNVLARWTHDRPDGWSRTLQAYYDRTERDDAFASETRGTFDLEFQARRTVGKHALVTGLGYRRSNSDLRGSFTFSTDPSRRTDDLLNIFIHDDVTLRPERLRVTLGVKLEHNEFTGVEVQPNLRWLWTPGDRNSFWAAASRAVRTPSRGEIDSRLLIDALPPDTLFPGAPSALVAFIGDPNFESEDMLAFEAGSRFVLRDELSLDVALFYNIYDSLVSLEPGTPFPEPLPVPSYLVVPMLPDNKSSGHTQGAELTLDWQPSPRWRIRTNVSSLHLDLEPDSDSMAAVPPDQGLGGWSPDHQWSVRSSVDLPRDLELDLFVRHVDKLDTLGVGDYTALDGRLAWRPSPALEIEVVGRNLTDNDDVEFVTSFINTASTVMGRSVYATVTWSF